MMSCLAQVYKKTDLEFKPKSVYHIICTVSCDFPSIKFFYKNTQGYCLGNSCCNIVLKNALIIAAFNCQLSVSFVPTFYFSIRKRLNTWVTVCKPDFIILTKWLHFINTGVRNKLWQTTHISDFPDLNISTTA